MADPKQLVINRNTWHYRYFIFIRNFWGFQKPPMQTSLCPYCQTMIWFSIFAFLLSPAIIAGWLALKFDRIAYKIIYRMGWEKTIDFIDDSILGQVLEEASEKGIRNAPAPTAIGALLGQLAFLSFFGLILVVLGTILYECVIRIPLVPHAVWTAMLAFGWAMFQVFSFIGYLMSMVVTGWYEVVAFFHNTALLLCIALWAARAFLTLLVPVVFMYLIFMFSRTSFARWVWDRIIFKLNGYKEAKDMSAKRREEERSKPEVEKPKRPYRPLLITRAWRRGLFYDDDEQNGIAIRTLTFFGIVGAFIWAIKKRACPLVVFADDPAPTQEQPKPAEPTGDKQ